VNSSWVNPFKGWCESKPDDRAAKRGKFATDGFATSDLLLTRARKTATRFEFFLAIFFQPAARLP